MPVGDESATSIMRGDAAGIAVTGRPLATVESTYVATLGVLSDEGGWKHVKPPKEGMTPRTSRGSWIKIKAGRSELVTTFWRNDWNTSKLPKQLC